MRAVVANNVTGGNNIITFNDSDLLRAIMESNDKIVQRLLDTIEKQIVLIDGLKRELNQLKNT